MGKFTCAIWLRGCPPGLASKGCIPPGQARKLFGYGDPYANWYGSPYWYWDDPGYYWSYWDGYAYRIDRVRCQGHARCVALAPEIFEADALGNGRAIGRQKHLGASASSSHVVHAAQRPHPVHYSHPVAHSRSRSARPKTSKPKPSYGSTGHGGGNGKKP